VKLPEPVEDQVEGELEGRHLLVRAVAQVLARVLVEVRVPVGRDQSLDRGGHVRDLRGVHGVTQLPEREAEDVAVERVVRVVGRVGREPRLA
jgi:hypothetical protein